MDASPFCMAELIRCFKNVVSIFVDIFIFLATGHSNEKENLLLYWKIQYLLCKSTLQSKDKLYSISHGP